VSMMTSILGIVTLDWRGVVFPPDPTSFEEGVLDENWKKEQAKYSRQIVEFNRLNKEYNAKLKSYVDSAAPDGYDDLKHKLQDLEPRIDEAYRNSQEIIIERQKSSIETEWDKMWNHAGKIQEQLNIKTKIPVKTINEYAYISANKDSVDVNGNKVYSVDDIVTANTFLNRLPPEDRENYDKMNKIIQAAYDFSDGIPREKYHGLTPEFALNAAIDYAKNNLGLQIETLKIVELDERDKKIELAKRQAEQETKATPMPANQLGVNDKSIEDTTSGFEKKVERLKVLTNIIKVNPTNFWKNPSNKLLQDEYNALSKDYLAMVKSKERTL
jgi:hypothetical protein